MADEKGGMSSTQIMVALIGAGAVVASAYIANSSRMSAPSAQPAALTNPEANQAAEVAAKPSVTEPVASPASTIPDLAGAWRGQDGSVWTFAQDGDRFSSEQTDGSDRVTIEGQVTGRTVRLWIDYFQAANPGLGLRIMNCDGRLDDDARRVTYNCINPQTNVTSRANWTKV